MRHGRIEPYTCHAVNVCPAARVLASIVALLLVPVHTG
jgi:hypothetical protein